jgi:hypothetical protein
VDTTPPEAPVISHAAIGHRQSILDWPVPKDNKITAFRVFRSTPQEGQNLTFERFVAEVPVSASPPVPQYQWIDSLPLDLPAGQKLSYRLAAVRSVRFGFAPGQVLNIPSNASSPVELTVMELLPPDPPDWIRAEWLDLSTGASPSFTTTEYTVLLVWSTPYPSATCTLQRRTRYSSTWMNITTIATGQRDLASGQFHFTYQDQNVNPGRQYQYRVQIKLISGRQNNNFREVEISNPA